MQKFTFKIFPHTKRGKETTKWNAIIYFTNYLGEQQFCHATKGVPSQEIAELQAKGYIESGLGKLNR